MNRKYNYNMPTSPINNPKINSLIALELWCHE